MLKLISNIEPRTFNNLVRLISNNETTESIVVIVGVRSKMWEEDEEVDKQTIFNLNQ